jgi:division protein CdvB (Snf7/Vps24/ESCRT-III family)
MSDEETRRLAAVEVVRRYLRGLLTVRELRDRLNEIIERLPIDEHHL